MVKLDRLKEKKKVAGGGVFQQNLTRVCLSDLIFLNFLELFPFLPETGFVLLY